MNPQQTTQSPPVLTIIDKLLNSPCPQCGEDTNDMKKVLLDQEGYICLQCYKAQLVEAYNPDSSYWWTCDCGNCDDEVLERGYIHVCFACEVDIKGGHAENGDNNLATPIICQSCRGNMLLFDFFY